MQRIFRTIWKVIAFIAFVASSVFFVTAAHAEQTLYQCLTSNNLKFGTLSERSRLALSYGIENYRGTAEQNADLVSLICPAKKFGGGYAPVTGYSTLTTSRVSASDTSIPVASVKDKAGNAILPSNISASSTVKMYFNFEAGTPREEPFYCTGISGLSLTGCVRGLSFQGSTLTGSSTIAQIHNAGASVIMTNLGAFYGNEFVATNGGPQDVWGLLTYQTYPKYAVTTTLPTLGAQFATKYYVDNVGAGGFTAANVSTTLGLLATGSAPEKVGINASTTRGIAFDSITGALQVNASTTQGLKFGTLGDLQFNPAATLNLTGVVTVVAGSGSLYVPTPTDPGMAANKLYVDQGITFFQATGTAAGTITAGRAVFVTSTGVLDQTNTTGATSTFQYVGLSTTSTIAGLQVTYTRPGGINCNQSGLTIGSRYYLNGTAGQISTSPASGRKVLVGTALSTTCIQLTSSPRIASGTITHGSVGAGTQDVVTQIGFLPSVVVLGEDGTVTGSTSDGKTWGTVIYNGTTQISSSCFNEDDNAATALTSANIASIPVLGSSGLGCYARSSGGNRAEMTITLNAVSGYGITTRVVNGTNAGAGGNSSATLTYMAIE